jgi:zinc transport system substrate-binding protein
MVVMTSLVATLAAAATLVVAACGSSTTGSASPAGPALTVTAAFYPLQWASERVGGDRVEVTALTKPGGEPHDLELTPKAVAGLASSDLVVYLRGFQPAVDAAVDTQAKDTSYDVGADADLALPARDEHGNGEHRYGDSEGTPGGAGPVDPHFWLDPRRFAAVATALGERFAAADAESAADYRANARALIADLTTLDAEFEKGLARCTVTDLVTGHAAFGYLATRYGLRQVGISGLSPDAEPDAASIRELSEYVASRRVSTVYSETLVDPALAETVARETGAVVAVLDPLEGLTDESAGTDYLEVMRSNLEALRAGQGCR